MVRVIVLFAMLIAAASAFVAPANRAVGKSVVAFDETGVIGLQLPKWSPFSVGSAGFFLARKGVLRSWYLFHVPITYVVQQYAREVTKYLEAGQARTCST
jgi:hypothetical protein